MSVILSHLNVITPNSGAAMFLGAAITYGLEPSRIVAVCCVTENYRLISNVGKHVVEALGQRPDGTFAIKYENDLNVNYEITCPEEQLDDNFTMLKQVWVLVEDKFVAGV